jgi:hypothetical protein
MPFGRPNPSRLIVRPGIGHPQGVLGVFSYYSLVMLLLNMACLTVAFAFNGTSPSNHKLFTSALAGVRHGVSKGVKRRPQFNCLAGSYPGVAACRA